VLLEKEQSVAETQPAHRALLGPGAESVVGEDSRTLRRETDCEGRKACSSGTLALPSGRTVGVCFAERGGLRTVLPRVIQE